MPNSANSTSQSSPCLIVPAQQVNPSPVVVVLLLYIKVWFGHIKAPTWHLKGQLRVAASSDIPHSLIAVALMEKCKHPVYEWRHLPTKLCVISLMRSVLYAIMWLWIWVSIYSSQWSHVPHFHACCLHLITARNMQPLTTNTINTREITWWWLKCWQSSILL